MENEGKSDLKSVLVVLLRNFVLGHQLTSAFAKNPVLDKRVAFFTDEGDKETIDVQFMYIDAKNGSTVPIQVVIEQFRRSLVRAVIAECHEAIKHYLATYHFGTLKAGKVMERS